LQLSRFDLAELAREVTARFESEAAEAGSPLITSAEQPAPVMADRMRIEQVLMNLLSNALKFAAGTAIEVRVESTPEVVRLAVSDGGMGIEPEAQERIFGRFERAAPESHYSGLGI